MKLLRLGVKSVTHIIDFGHQFEISWLTLCLHQINLK